MILYLPDADVRRILSFEQATEKIDELFRLEAESQVINLPTTELRIPNGVFRLKAGLVAGLGVYGFKAYPAGGYRVFVYDAQTNALLGIVDARGLTEIRTAAVSAVGARYMARRGSETLGIIGTGREARAQVQALCKELPIQRIRAYSRGADHREAFAAEMSAKLEIPVEPVESGEACVRDADVVVTMTNARDPVLYGAWLREGTFICAVGATTPERRELDEEAVARCGTIAIEHLPQASVECGELLRAVERGDKRWEEIHELKEIVSGAVPGRRSADEITLFDTIGIGSEDVALAQFVLCEARARHAGQELPMKELGA